MNPPVQAATGPNRSPFWRNDYIAAATILVVTFTIFRLSPVRILYDSGYTMLFSQHLLWDHSFSLEARSFPILEARKPGTILQPGVDLPYQLYQSGERFYDFYPPGSAVLSMPYVALANAMGISAIDANAVHDARGESRIQRGLAPLLMALFSVIVFFTSRLFLSFEWSLLIAVGTAFGTQVWSDASRSVWSQTWGMVVLGAVIWLVVRAETKGTRLAPVLLGTCVAWLYFIRPTFSSSILAIAIYVLLYHRNILIPFVATGFAWLVVFVAFSKTVFGTLLPPYYNQPGGFPYLPSLWPGLPGNLISPSRGLFIYVPILLFVVYLLTRYRPWCRPQLVRLAGAVVLAHLVIISLVTGWHGGHCYGPRLSMDLLPWLVLLAILAVKTRLLWQQKDPANNSIRRRRIEWGLAGLLLFCSVVLNGIGALSWEAWHWNMRPNDIDYHRDRLWDWKHPQFLAPLQLGRHPQR